MIMKRAGGCCIGLALVALSVGASAGATSSLAVSRVADGVYLHHGVQAEANSRNGGDIANIGFVVGARCVAVIDTGGTPAIGRRLKAAVHDTTDRPICYVINTHMHPDHVFGNRAFENTTARFVAAADYPPALAARADSYLERVRDTLDASADTSWVVMPDETVTDRSMLNLGGRRLVLEAWPTAHTDNDLTVFDPATGTLWSGDLLFVERVPSLDGSLLGWLSVLEELASQAHVHRVIPGHGPISETPATVYADERRYLSTLRDDVTQAIDSGQTLNETMRHAAADQRRDWLLFDAYNPRNVSAAFTELEWQ